MVSTGVDYCTNWSPRCLLCLDVSTRWIINTCDLSNNGLRDPPVIQEGLDLLLHQVAISPTTTNTHYISFQGEQMVVNALMTWVTWKETWGKLSNKQQPRWKRKERIWYSFVDFNCQLTLTERGVECTWISLPRSNLLMAKAISQNNCCKLVQATLLCHLSAEYNVWHCLLCSTATLLLCAPLSSLQGCPTSSVH